LSIGGRFATCQQAIVGARENNWIKRANPARDLSERLDLVRRLLAVALRFNCETVASADRAIARAPG